MKAGDVVVVTAKLDERVRSSEGADPIGTLVQIDQTTAWVILPNADLWIGSKKFIFPVDGDVDVQVEPEQEEDLDEEDWDSSFDEDDLDPTE
jgi:hypothetical protein